MFHDVDINIKADMVARMIGQFAAFQNEVQRLQLRRNVTAITEKKAAILLRALQCNPKSEVRTCEAVFINMSMHFVLIHVCVPKDTRSNKPYIHTYIHTYAATMI